VSLCKEDVSALELALGEELQDLDEALAGLLDQRNVELDVQEMNARLEVVEDFVSVVDDGFFTRDHQIVELGQEIVQDVHHDLQGLLLLVLQH